MDILPPAGRKGKGIRKDGGKQRKRIQQVSQLGLSTENTVGGDKAPFDGNEEASLCPLTVEQVKQQSKFSTNLLLLR